LTGVYYVKKGKRLILEKKGHYLKNVGPGLYFFLPILYEAWDFYFEGSATYTVKCGKAKVVYVGELQDPEAYCEGRQDREKKIREVLKNKGEDVPLSLQIKDSIESKRLEIGSASSLNGNRLGEVAGLVDRQAFF
jgi:hypothetical protein